MMQSGRDVSESATLIGHESIMDVPWVKLGTPGDALMTHVLLHEKSSVFSKIF